MNKMLTGIVINYGISYLRSRLNLKFNNEGSYAFVQVQDARIFGSETNTLDDGSADATDYHQAYFNVSDVFTQRALILGLAGRNQRMLINRSWVLWAGIISIAPLKYLKQF